MQIKEIQEGLTIEEMKNEIEKLLCRVERPGIGPLMKFLEDEGFYEVPASTKYHSSFEGGLALHSLFCYYYYQEMLSIMGGYVPSDSVIIEGLLHDICKIDCYTKKGEPASDKQLNYLASLIKKNNLAKKMKEEIGMLSELDKNYASTLIDWLLNHPEEDIPEKEEKWTWTEDYLPAGHGEKSVSILQRFIPLENRELLAIRWHMGAWEDGVANGSKGRSLNQAHKLFSDIGFLRIADGMATFNEELEQSLVGEGELRLGI
ncbi:MAG: hypothetical protein ACOC4G_13010 [Bacillota bacterium]